MGGMASWKLRTVLGESLGVAFPNAVILRALKFAATARAGLNGIGYNGSFSYTHF